MSVRLAMAAAALVALSAAASARAVDSVVTFTYERHPGDPCCLIEASLDGAVRYTYDVRGIGSDGVEHVIAGHGESTAHDGATAYYVGDGQDPSNAVIGGIWLARRGGSLTRLTTSFHDTDPAVSPDGSRVAFTRWDPLLLRSDVFVVNTDGTGLRRLTSGVFGGASFQWPQFSPDGRAIAYSCARSGQPGAVIAPPCGPAVTREYDYFGLMLMNADGTNQRMIVKDFESPVGWAPDGRHVVGYGYRSRATSLVVLRTDGQDLYSANTIDPLLMTDEMIGPPSFSSDGSRVLFGLVGTDVETDPTGYWTVPAAGGTPERAGLVEFGGRFVPPETGGVAPRTVAPVVRVPPLQGTKLSFAYRRIRIGHLRVGHVTRAASHSVARGRVIRQVPRGGRVRHAGAPVNLVVSRGRR